ncbi:AraC family transcriptional regulator [Pedobacter sp. MR22-3]|uniref:AraC family transcriptional regulator n=1 Tax=Pedobacter sp. MR22-3 TaxID=2994552 RepID=UPI0022459142|nr:AraC family transcriptional regulator [Pedobacter sp. MR22-3]MCX2585648.1 AraC family transcriptional regulator [Pedobacter sp. MR22-3]
MKGITRIPRPLTSDPKTQAILVLEDCSIAEHCTHEAEIEGTMFLQEHLLLFVLAGTNKLSYGNQLLYVNQHEMILLKKSTVVHYQKIADSNNVFDCMMFSIPDGLLKSFLSTSDLMMPSKTETTTVDEDSHPMNDRLLSFAESLKPYFYDGEIVLPGQIRLKFMEMLYDVATCNTHLFQQILQLNKPMVAAIHDVMERHYMSSLTIKDFAYLSGRSLSSFKRDFQQIYNTSPEVWIRNKRLERAKTLLESTALNVSEIGNTLGFENISHFSKVFREKYSCSPTTYRATHQERDVLSPL